MVKKILVVDDDSEDLNAIQAVLKDYEVTTAKNGAEALDNTKKEGFDLILLDVQMPTLSGYDLIRLLKEKLEKKVPIIYVTIVPKKEVDISEVDGFIQKPFTPESLLTEVRRLTGRKR